MKNKKGNKHLKNEPFMTLREHLKDYYYVILTKCDPEDTFEYIVCKDKKVGAVYLDSATAMLDGCIFRTEKDAETFLNKMVRNIVYESMKEVGDKDKGNIPKDEIERELKYYRVMSVEEMNSPYRKLNEQKEIDVARVMNL